MYDDFNIRDDTIMAKITVGVIGETGRMGSILTEMIGQDPRFELGIGYSMENSGDAALDRVFQENDLVIDFSHASHAVSNVFFIVVFSASWMKILRRIQGKYGLLQEQPG